MGQTSHYTLPQIVLFQCDQSPRVSQGCQARFARNRTFYLPVSFLTHAHDYYNCFSLLYFSHHDREAWEKVNVTWLENGKQVSYGQKKTYFFRKDLSVAGEETILTLPNLPMLVSSSLYSRICQNETFIFFDRHH